LRSDFPEVVPKARETQNLANVEIATPESKTVAKDDEQVKAEHYCAGFAHHHHEVRYGRNVDYDANVSSEGRHAARQDGADEDSN
jgi:hypothetical protein